MLPLFQHRDGQTRLRELGSHNRTTGTRPDDHDVELRTVGELTGRPDPAGRARRSRARPQRRTRHEQALMVSDLTRPPVASPLTHRADPRIGFVTDPATHLRLLVVREDDKVTAQQHHTPQRERPGVPPGDVPRRIDRVEPGEPPRPELKPHRARLQHPQAHSQHRPRPDRQRRHQPLHVLDRRLDELIR